MKHLIPSPTANGGRHGRQDVPQHSSQGDRGTADRHAGGAASPSVRACRRVAPTRRTAPTRGRGARTRARRQESSLARGLRACRCRCQGHQGVRHGAEADSWRCSALGDHRGALESADEVVVVIEVGAAAHPRPSIRRSAKWCSPHGQHPSAPLCSKLYGHHKPGVTRMSSDRSSVNSLSITRAVQSRPTRLDDTAYSKRFLAGYPRTCSPRTPASASTWRPTPATGPCAACARSHCSWSSRTATSPSFH